MHLPGRVSCFRHGLFLIITTDYAKFLKEPKQILPSR